MFALVLMGANVWEFAAAAIGVRCSMEAKGHQHIFARVTAATMTSPLMALTVVGSHPVSG